MFAPSYDDINRYHREQYHRRKGYRRMTSQERRDALFRLTDVVVNATWAGEDAVARDALKLQVEMITTWRRMSC